jgi:hypothetical protein
VSWEPSLSYWQTKSRFTSSFCGSRNKHSNSLEARIFFPKGTYKCKVIERMKDKFPVRIIKFVCFWCCWKRLEAAMIGKPPLLIIASKRRCYAEKVLGTDSGCLRPNLRLLSLWSSSFIEYYLFPAVNFHRPTWKFFCYNCWNGVSVRNFSKIITYQNKKRSK